MDYAIQNIIEKKEIFDPILSVNQGKEKGKFMLIEHIEEECTGIFPHISDYTRMADRIEKKEISEFIPWLSKKSSRLSINVGYYKIEKNSKDSNKATLSFNTPITVCIKKINGKPVTALVNKIKGKFTWEWSWINSRQDKMTIGFDVWFDCQEYFLIT